MPKLLILVEDEKVAKQIAADLSIAGYDTEIIVDELPRTIDADVVLLDIPSAARWAARLKSNTITADLPLLGLAGDSEIEDDLLALLDDFSFVTTATRQLLMRIKRLLLKSGKVIDKTRIRVGELVINLESYEVSINRAVVELTYKEYELLKFLAGHPGRVYDRQTLLNQIWEYDYFGGTRTVDVHIRRLRAKLGSKYGSMIQTVRHVGYRFSYEKEV